MYRLVVVQVEQKTTYRQSDTKRTKANGGRERQGDTIRGRENRRKYREILFVSISTRGRIPP